MFIMSKDLSPNRILILGCSGSGKTFLAQKISKNLNISAYDLDDIFFERKYNIKRNENDRIKLLKKITKGKKWIIEGVYSSWIDDAVKKSNLVILLDIPFRFLAWRIFIRYLLRYFKGNKESFKDMIILIKYAFKYKSKNQTSGLHKHNELINRHSAKYVIIKNKGQLNELIIEKFNNNINS